MNRRKFITACAACASCAIMPYAIKRCRSYSIPHERKLQHIEIQVCEHCNLSCDHCCYFSSISSERFYDIERFGQDMAQLSKVTGGGVGMIKLLGGEPLLHPEINKFFEISRKNFPCSRIELITNATLLNSKDERFWRSLKKNRIVIVPSIYDVKVDWASILDKAQRFGVQMIADDESTKLSLENLEKFKRKKFFKLNLDKQAKRQISRNCSRKTLCTGFFEGKIYPCFIASTIHILNRERKTDFKITQKDYLDIYKIKNVGQILDFLEGDMPFCAYCAEFSSGFDWKMSKEHDTSEWLISNG